MRSRIRFVYSERFFAFELNEIRIGNADRTVKMQQLVFRDADGRLVYARGSPESRRRNILRIYVEGHCADQQPTRDC